MNYYDKSKGNGNLFQDLDDYNKYNFRIGAIDYLTASELSYNIPECMFFYKSLADFNKEIE